MAQITLAPGETFTVVGSTNTFSGSTTGSETVIVSGGINSFTPDFNAGGDRIVLTGSIGQYTVQRSGSSIIFNGPNGVRVTFPAPNPNLPDTMNPVISFTAGNTRDFVLDSTTAGVFMLGDTVIGTTPVVVANTDPIVLNVTASNALEYPFGPGLSTGVFTFTLAGGQPRAFTLDIATIGGTAIPGVDYTIAAQTIAFAPYQTVQFLTYTVLDDLRQEGTETIGLQLSLPDGVVLAPGADLVATIFENAIFDDFPAPLRVGPDNYPNGPFVFAGSLAPGQTGKLLGAEDTIVGRLTGAIRVTDTDGRSIVDDVDFTGVTNISTLQTNFTTIRLGAQADRAGIVALDTQRLTDGRNFAAAGSLQGGALVDLTGDANGDGVIDFDNPFDALLANSGADTIRITLQSPRVSTIDTGMTFQPAMGVAIGPIDGVEIVGQVNPVRLTLAPADVGNGTPYQAGTQVLSVRAQATDSVGVLIGGGTRFDDEGIRFTGASFTIDDGMRLIPGFSEAVLGTGLADTLSASGAGAVYIVGGLGDDRITGGVGADTLIGGGGRDTFVYTSAGQSRGSAYDTIVDFTYGSDTIDLPGGARSVTRVAAGPVNAASFDSDLTALFATALTAGGAVLMTAIGGTLDGATFLVADGNGVAGYQAGADFVIRLPEPPVTLPAGLIV